MKTQQPTPNELTDHHVVPTSRGGNTGKRNQKQVPNKYHMAFHHLFENMTPEEIVSYLDEVWFKPQERFIGPAKWLQKNGYF